MKSILSLFGRRSAVPTPAPGSAAEQELFESLKQARFQLEQERQALDRTLDNISAVKLKEKVAALNEAKNFSRSLFAGLPCPVIAVDLEARITAMNPAAQTALGITVDLCGSLYSETLSTGQDDILLETLRNGAAARRGPLTLAAGNRRFSFAATTALLRNAEGAAAGALAVLEPAAGAAVEWSAADIMTGVARCIKNPLGIISGYVQLLPRSFDDAEFRRRFTEIVTAETEKMTRLAQALSGFESIVDVGSERCNLNDALRSALALIAPDAANRKVAVNVAYGEGLPPVRCSNRYLVIALRHLLTNALQSMPQGGTVEAKTFRDGAGAAVSVRDTGCGIPPDNIDDVMKPFFTTRSDALGLGLAVVKRIADGCGGSVRINSMVHSGTEVTICLPAEEEVHGA